MKVKNAEEATEIATLFTKKYRRIALPVKAVKEGENWDVELDVGPLSVNLARIMVDAETREVSYEIPESPQFNTEQQAQSIHYLENAITCIEAGNSQKASEFLWSSLVEALKAIAVTKGIELRTHASIREYAKELAKDQKDASIFEVFRKAESLHRSYFELGSELEEVYILSLEMRVLLEKLFELMG